VASASSSNSSSVLSSPITNQEPASGTLINLQQQQPARKAVPRAPVQQPLPTKGNKILVQKNNKTRPVSQLQEQVHTTAQPQDRSRVIPQKQAQSNPRQTPVENNSHSQSTQSSSRNYVNNKNGINSQVSIQTKYTKNRAIKTNANNLPVKSQSSRIMPVEDREAEFEDDNIENDQVNEADYVGENVEDECANKYYQNEEVYEEENEQNEDVEYVIEEEAEQEEEAYDQQDDQECYIEENQEYYDEADEQEYEYQPEDMEEDELDIDQNKSTYTYAANNANTADSNINSPPKNFIRQNIKKMFNPQKQYQEMPQQPQSSTRIVHQSQPMQSQTDFIYPANNNNAKSSNPNGAARQVNNGQQARNQPMNNKLNGFQKKQNLSGSNSMSNMPTVSGGSNLASSNQKIQMNRSLTSSIRSKSSMSGAENSHGNGVRNSSKGSMQNSKHAADHEKKQQYDTDEETNNLLEARSNSAAHSSSPDENLPNESDKLVGPNEHSDDQSVNVRLIVIFQKVGALMKSNVFKF
jgi:hypothetical protein